MIFFCIYNLFREIRARFNKLVIILAYIWLICLCKFGILLYVFKIDIYFLLCILSYYTYSGREYLDIHFRDVSWVLACLFIVNTICAHPGVYFVHPKTGRNKHGI